MIRFDHVEIAYPGVALPAVRDVSLEARTGSVTAIAGPNGSGKSTLVRALLGRVTPRRGRVTLDDMDVASLDRKSVARRLAVVTQREEPAFALRVRDFVLLGRYAHRARWFAVSPDDDVAVEQALHRAEVASLRERMTDTLSGGVWQRVRLARALAQGARALVLDEPTTYLDVGHEMALFELVESLAGDGHAILLVSHQLNLVARFASHLVLLHQGQVAAAGTPAHVMTVSTLERVYEWPLLVATDAADGAPALVPLRRNFMPSRVPPDTIDHP